MGEIVAPGRGNPLELRLNLEFCFPGETKTEDPGGGARQFGSGAGGPPRPPAGRSRSVAPSGGF